MKAPIAKKIPKALNIHNHTRTDDYYWLNERENPEVIAYLEAENSYSKAMLSDTEALQKSLYEEIKGKIVKDESSVPYKSNGYWYYSRYEEGLDYPIYCRKRESLESDEVILLNINTLAKGHEYYAVGSLTISPDNTMLCFGVDTLSRRIYTLYFKNLETGEIASHSIAQTEGSGIWSADSRMVFYTQLDTETLRPHKAFRHVLGVAEDVEIFHEADDAFWLDISKSKSKAYIFIESHSTVSSEIQLLSTDKPLEALACFTPRTRDLEYMVEHQEGLFYILTNHKAKNFRLMQCGIDHTHISGWTETIAHRDDVLLEGFEVFNDYLVLEEKKEGLGQICILEHETKQSHYLDFGEESYSAFTTSNVAFDTKVLRYGYSSLTTPPSTLEYHMHTRCKTLLKESKVLGDFDKEAYISKRIWATAKDGVRVPLSLVYKKGTALDGQSPLLQYAYGSYGYAMDAYFSVSRLSLLDRGFVFAIAHIRGGEEMGRHWYEDGNLLNKRNTFSDFIACSEYLVAQGYASKDKLFAQGGSAGGLLMGAVVNMRPELYAGVIADVPFVYVVTTMLDESIPLTTGEYDEWGNPNEKVFYDYMLSYSPYDNVAKQDYPHMLVMTGLHDSQVQYWEPAKWVAKLRDYKTDQNMLLLHTNLSTGHGGASGRFESLKEVALEYAFLLKVCEG